MNDYQAALDYVFSYIDMSLTHQENIAPEKFNLDRMGDFLAALGEPHQAYSCIHVAGTKGKGSVSVLCAAALKAGGMRTGLYTSPHLQDFRERIQVDGEMISEESFVRLVEEIKPVVAGIPGLTSYEIQTALAFWHFSKEKVDIAVLEVGLGGRLDSTNVVRPLVSVITPVSMDHTFILGDTLALIAGEKGGIIKEGIPVVSSPQEEEALTVLKTIAEEKRAPLTLVGEDVEYDVLGQSLRGQKVIIRQGEDALEVKLGLLGAHQAENAAAAYAALAQVREAGIEISKEAIQQGFGEVKWPGRFEVVGDSPPVVLDGAHNRHSAGVLRDAVETYFPGQEVVLLFGASEDKDVAGMFAELLPGVRTMVAAASGHPRAMGIEQIRELAGAYACEVVTAEDMEGAIRGALAAAGERGVVLATGSLYLVGEVRSVWYDKFS